MQEAEIVQGNLAHGLICGTICMPMMASAPDIDACGGDSFQLLPEAGALVEFCHSHLSRHGRTVDKVWHQAGRVAVLSPIFAQSIWTMTIIRLCVPVTSPNSRRTSKNWGSFRMRRLARFR